MWEVGARREARVLCLQTQLSPTQVMSIFLITKYLKAFHESWLHLAPLGFVLFSLLKLGLNTQ